MAKATVDTGVDGQSIHTRTTGDSAESQAVVIGIDGSDSVVPAHATDGLKVNLGADNDVTITSGSVTVTGSVTASDGGVSLSIDDGGNVITVDGTVAVTQSGTWDEVGINDSGNSITVDDGGLTLSVDDGGSTVSVDDGGGSFTVDAPTATPVAVRIGDGTLNATIRDAGSADALNVAIVDGSGNHITSFGGSGGTSELDDADFTDGTTSGTPAMGVYESTPSTVTDGDLGIVGITVDREQKVNDADAIALLTTIDADTGGILTSVQTLDNAISGSEMQVDVVAALPAGTNNIGDVDIASIAAGDNNIGNVDIASIAAGDNNIGNVDIVSLPNEGQQTMANSISVAVASDQSRINTSATLAATATGGASTFHSNDLDETEEDVKTSAGTVYGWIITNRTTAPVYIHFYNATAANVTVGTTAPLFIFAVPGNSADYIAANVLGGMGIAFSTAISVAATTDFPDDGTPAGPATNGVVCTVFYA